MSEYPDKDLVIDTIVEVARTYIADNTPQRNMPWHPVDLAYMFTTVAEVVGETLASLYRAGALK